VDAVKAMTASFDGLPIGGYCIGHDLADLESRFAAAYGISDSGAALVRPDGYVAWRSIDGAAEPVTALRAALHASLCSQPPTPKHNEP